MSEQSKTIEQIAEMLAEIEGQSKELRSGGPDPMDLQGLSDGLSRATELATEAGNLLATLASNEAKIAALTKALEQIASGTLDEVQPFRGMPREEMQRIATAALSSHTEQEGGERG